MCKESFNQQKGKRVKFIREREYKERYIFKLREYKSR